MGVDEETEGWGSALGAEESNDLIEHCYKKGKVAWDKGDQRGYTYWFHRVITLERQHQRVEDSAHTLFSLLTEKGEER